jgi:hypothetical protein
LLFSSRILRYPFFAMQGETLISSSSGKRLVAGEGGKKDLLLSGDHTSSSSEMSGTRAKEL